MGRIPDTQQYKVVRETPIARLGCAGAVVYLQSGCVWDDGGKEILELPGWVYESMRRMTPAALKAVGYDKVPEPPSNLIVSLNDPSPPELWTCPNCEKVMQLDNKEAHIAKHNRHLAPDAQMKSDSTLHMKH